MVPRTTWSKAVDEAERHLVHAATETIGDTGADQARRYTVDELGRLATRIREHLDPDGAEPRDAVKQALRGFSYPKVGADGMARGKYALPPLQLGIFLTAVDSILSPRTPDPEGPPPASDESDPDERGYVPPDLRTSEQKLLDAVMALIEMAAAHNGEPSQHAIAAASSPDAPFRHPDVRPTTSSPGSASPSLPVEQT